MQGFAFNTRKDIFKDRRVREALSYAFDFEWTNKNLFYDAYKRTNSFFENSELASFRVTFWKRIGLSYPLYGCAS